MRVKSASNNVVMQKQNGITTRQVTEKEVRRKLFWQVVQTIAWGFFTFVDTRSAQRMGHIFLLIMSGMQVANYVDQLRRIRRGEIVEVTVRTTRTNPRQNVAITIAAFVTAIAVVATYLNLGNSTPIVFISLFIWLPLLFVWYRILTGGERPTLTGTCTQNTIAEAQNAQADAAAAASPAHWWTQNAVRDEVQVQSVGSRPQTNDR